MFGGKEKSSALFDILDSELQGILKPDSRSGQYEKDLKLRDPWHKIGEIDPFKAKVIHSVNKLFIKSFSPRAAEYANTAYAVISQLSGLSLKYPVLPVIGKSGNSLFFDLGVDEGHLGWEYLPESDRELIYRLVTENGLDPLGRFNKVPIIRLGNQRFVTDPFEDSVYSVSLFIERE